MKRATVLVDDKFRGRGNWLRSSARPVMMLALAPAPFAL
jgi:hypothetical protein